jgi:CHAD domain-containing protein
MRIAMKPFAQKQVSTLLRRLAAQVKRTAEVADADSVHDLRVAIRRLSRALRSFAPFFPGKQWKRIRKQLSNLMAGAAAVRDNDVALELIEKAGVTPRAPVAFTLRARRRTAEAELREELQNWLGRGFAREWREALEL